MRGGGFLWNGGMVGGRKYRNRLLITSNRFFCLYIYFYLDTIIEKHFILENYG